MGAAIFPENSKYGGGPEKMAIVAVGQRWRRCSGRQRQPGSGCSQALKPVEDVRFPLVCVAQTTFKACERLLRANCLGRFALAPFSC